MDRAHVSRRLKAARWLAGGEDEKGRPVPLSPEELAQREPLLRNGISANAISEIERMVKDARPMERRELCRALDLPATWFDFSTPLELDATETINSLRQALVDAERHRQEDLAAIGVEVARQVSLAIETGVLPTVESSAATERRAANG